MGVGGTYFVLLGVVVLAFVIGWLAGGDWMRRGLEVEQEHRVRLLVGRVQAEGWDD